VTDHAPAARADGPLLVEFTATRADMAAFQTFVTARVWQSVRTARYYALLAGVIVAAATVLSVVDIDPVTVIATAAVFAASWWIISREYRRGLAPLAGGSLVGARRVELSEAGVRQVADRHDAFTRWDGVLMVEETSTHLFLMTDRLAGYIVPRSAFADAAAYARFSQFTRQHAARPMMDGAGNPPRMRGWTIDS